jgi:DNA-binding MarR family transcriptional regulator
MSRGKNDTAREAIIATLNDEVGRKSSTATILFQMAIADHMGLGLTDLVCGEILSRTGPIAAGELAELSGLTTGAITGVVDRLEKAGLVRRVNDPDDRRRVILEPVTARFEESGRDPYTALEEAFSEVYARYTDEQLVILLDFLRRSVDIYDEQAARIRAEDANRSRALVPAPIPFEPSRPLMRIRADANIRIVADAKIQTNKPSKGERTFTAPLEHPSAGRLEFLSGPADIKINALSDPAELYRARFRHTIPTVRVQENDIAIQYRYRTLFGREGGEADLALNATLPWDIKLETGPGAVSAELRGIPLQGFALSSKASKIFVNLPAPSGKVGVQIESGMSNIVIRRPPGVPVRVELGGDSSRFSLDKQRWDSVEDDVRETPDYKRAADSFLIEIKGGSSKISVEESK